MKIPKVVKKSYKYKSKERVENLQCSWLIHKRSLEYYLITPMNKIYPTHNRRDKIR